jgi:hypothetical protein
VSALHLSGYLDTAADGGTRVRGSTVPSSVFPPDGVFTESEALDEAAEAAAAAAAPDVNGTGGFLGIDAAALSPVPAAALLLA